MAPSYFPTGATAAGQHSMPGVIRGQGLFPSTRRTTRPSVCLAPSPPGCIFFGAPLPCRIGYRGAADHGFRLCRDVTPVDSLAIREGLDRRFSGRRMSGYRHTHAPGPPVLAPDAASG